MHFLTIGILLGLSAGFAPGPLLALVIVETIRHNVGAGIKVALAPIITDLPIVAVSVLLLSSLSEHQHLLGAISLAGGLFVLYMAYESISSRGYEPDPADGKPNSLWKGVVVNALSPHPYLFWFSVGAPMVARAMDDSLISPVLFILGFYVFLVGSKISLAVVVARSKAFLQGRAYLLTMRALGLLLSLFALSLFVDGLELLGFM